MSRLRRTNTELGGSREALRAAVSLGADLKRTRVRRRLTLEQLAGRVGIGRSRLQELEAGQGASAPLRIWFALGVALERPFAAAFTRQLVEGPADAGHLIGQELVLRLAREAGRVGLFELSTRPASRDSGSTDVGIRDDRHRALILIEIWNRLTDLGVASRSSRRKQVEAADLAAFRGYRVATCWLLVGSAANHELVRRYPEVFRSQFTGSSTAWVRCLVDGEPPPERPGIAWIDAVRIRPLRLRGSR